MRILHVGEVVRGGIVTYLRAVVPKQRTEYGDGVIFGLVPGVFEKDVAGIFPALLRANWNGRSPLSLWRYFRSVREAIEVTRPDLIHAHSTFPGAAVRLAAALIPKRRRPMVVYCAHGWAFKRETSGLKKRLYAGIERALTPLADGVVHISNDEAAAADAFGIRPRSQITIYNGLPNRPETDDRSDAPKAAAGSIHFLFVGRLDRQKGFDILAAALKSVERNDIVVHVVGDAVVPKEAVDTSSGARLDPRLRFHGWLRPDELDPLYQRAHAVIMPSRWEGFGYVAIEAMRARCAVFASRRGALPEIVEEAVTGHLFDPSSPAELVKLIEKADLPHLCRLGEEGRRQYLRRFDETACSAALIAYYRQLMVRQAPVATTGLTPLNDAGY
jgi:glycosyltransferase involved in cell wall biosynthesis